jgi:alpha-maltose-1-phosphate synthase
VTDRPRVALLTREYPPEVYGGAGVHVEHLAAALVAGIDVEVHCFGGPRDGALVAGAYEPWKALDGPQTYRAALRALSVDLAMVAGVEGVDLVHSHTWYANLAGHLSKLVHGIPHIATTHSLEPLRPWKREQLGGGYELSSFAERVALEGADAIIAVSAGMREDVLAAYPSVAPEAVRVIHNGIDAELYRPTDDDVPLIEHGIDPRRPIVAFVGRITRQKGLPHLLAAAHHLDPRAQLVLCAGAADTPELAREVSDEVERLRAARDGVVWIEAMLSREQIVAILSHASVLVCPSVYEPFGLVNVEAMACATAVVATAVGGVPEIVVEGETGYLVSFEADGGGEPRDPDALARDLAGRVNRLVDDPDLARRLGEAGRERVLERFTWEAVAERTAALYRELT